MIRNDTLTPKQRRAIAALLAQPSIAAAARAVGVGRMTLNRWLGNADFRAALAEAEATYVDESLRNLVRTCNQAVSVLEDVMSDPKATASVKVRAAASVLDNLLKLREHVDFDARIRRLEERNSERA